MIDRLEKRARELEVWKQERARWAHDCGPAKTFYDYQAADDRELLLEAAKKIRELGTLLDGMEALT